MRLRRSTPAADALLRVGAPGEPVDEADLFTETRAQEITRRLEACEAHLTDLEDRLTGYGRRLIEAEYALGNLANNQKPARKRKAAGDA